MGIQPNPYPLRIDPEIMSKTKVIAKANGRSVNKEIEIVLKQYVISYEKDQGPIVIRDLSQAE